MADDTSLSAQVISGYESDAPNLIAKYESLSPEIVLRPVAGYLPSSTATLLDVGAGPGSIAAWMASRGCQVVAVEPTAAFRNFGQEKHTHSRISWVDDRLPDLPVVCCKGQFFDTVMAIGVLHHLRSADQEIAIETMAAVLSTSGQIILSLRNGPGPASRPGFPVFVDRLVHRMRHLGLRAEHRSQKQSIQSENRSAGVT